MSTYGWKSIFGFTFVQTAKSKAFKISSIIIIILVFGMALLAGLLPAIIGGNSSSGDSDIVIDGEKPLDRIYIADTTGITTAADYEKVFGTFGLTPVFSGDESDSTALIEQIKGETRSLLVTISETEGGYSIYAARPADSSVSSDTANSFGSAVQQVFNLTRLAKEGLNGEQIAAVEKTISFSQSIAGEPTENDFAFFVKMIVPMLSSIALFILIFSYGQLVAQSIAQEKTSKVMELLLTSVRPLAVVIGKILAMGSLALLQFIMIIMSGILGICVSMPLTGMMVANSQDASAMTQQLTEEIGKAFADFSPISIIMIFVIFIIGFIFFALIAGLIGASVSRMEDLNAAMQPLAIIGVLGFYLAYFPSAMGGEAGFMSTLSYYLPISSPFALPSALLTGAMDIPQALLAVAVLCVFTVLMALLVARVYEQIILHNGNRLKLGDIIGIAKNK